jgi:hypothetical protein
LTIFSRYFVSERKAAIPLEDVSNKLAESYTSTLSSGRVKFMQLVLKILFKSKCFPAHAGTGQKHVMKSLNIFLQWVSPIALPVVPLLAM